MSDIRDWTPTAAGMLNVAPPDGFPEQMPPGTVNDSSREVQASVRRQFENCQWFDAGHSVTRLTNTSFKVNGLNVVSMYQVGRRLRFLEYPVGGSPITTLYGDVETVAYTSPDTTVDVALDVGTLSIELSEVAVGIVSPENGSLRELSFAKAGIGLSKSAKQLDINWSTLSTVTSPDTDSGTIAMRDGFVHQEVPLSSVAGGTPGSSINLKMIPGSLPNSSVVVSADLTILTGSNGGLYPVRGPYSETCNFNNSGAGGIDTGVFEDSQWYYIYVISNRTSVRAIASKNDGYNGVSLPSGYDYLGLVGAVYNASTSGTLDLLKATQIGKIVSYQEIVLRKDGSQPANTWSANSLSDEIPKTASRVNVVLSCNTSPIMGASPFDDGKGGQYFTAPGGGDSSNFGNALSAARNNTVSCWIPVVASRNIYTFFGGSPVTIHIAGYEYA